MSAHPSFVGGRPRSRLPFSVKRKTIAPSFPALFEAAPGAYVLLSTTFKILAASDAYLATMGTSRADITGKNIVQVFPAGEPATGDTIRASLERVVAERLPDTMPVQRYAVAGSATDTTERYWSVTNSPVLADGRIALIIHQVTDVTDFVAIHEKDASLFARQTAADRIAERRTAAELIAESQRSLAEAQAIAHVGSFLWDVRTGDVAWSDEQYRLFGYEPGAIQPNYQLVLDLIHHDDRDEVERLSQRCATLGEQFDIEFRAVHPDGTVHWMHARGAATIENGVPIRMMGTCQDITASRKSQDDRIALRQEMETELRQSEQLFRGAFDAAGRGIALIAPDGRTYVDVNQAMCDMLGYGKEELLELGWLAVTHPDDRDRNMSEVDEFLAGEVDSNVISKRYIRKDGEVIHVEIIDTLVRAPDGSPDYFITHVTDVTERERSRLDNEKLQAQLRQAQKMEAVGQLAGGVAHDFNNILAVILNYAEFVIEDLPPGDSRLADVEEIIKAGEKAAQLVHQLLAFSRQEVVKERVLDLNAVVAGMRTLLDRTLGEDTQFVFDLSPGLPPVKADPGQIEQVLMNLVVNGRDAMSAGGLLTVSTGTERVAEGQRLGLPAGTYVKLAVSDTGEGMDEATVDRVFEPFFTTKLRGEGTGLGLATVYGIVKQANGGVYIDSQLGEGTTFSVYLPPTADAVGEIDEKPSALTLGGGEAIVLVEDEDAVRNLTERILAARGYEVASFADPAEALAFCRENPTRVDLLLTDVVMPKMSGKSLSDEASRVVTELRTLFMSGYTDEAIATRGVLEEGENLLFKPFKAVELLAKVRSLLDA